MESQYLNPRGTAPTTTAEVIAIRPGPPLTGTVTVDGSKNAALPLLAAAAVLPSPVRLNNLPASSDVHVMITLLREAGLDVGGFPGQDDAVLVAPASARRPNPELLSAAGRIRASYYLVPALLALYGRALLPWPGGCRIGDRGMEQHFRVYEAYGDRCSSHHHGYEVALGSVTQRTVSVALPFRSRGATVAAILRAVVSGCELRLAKPNLSPEVRGVIDALGTIGWVADARRDLLVLVPPVRTTEASGVWSVPGDKVEAGTLACAVAATAGTARIEGIRSCDIAPATARLRRAGVVVTEEPDALMVDAREIGTKGRSLHASASLSPDGLDADFEPSLLALALGVPGHHAFADTINPGRHANLIPQLRSMGAEIEEISPTQCRFTGPQRLTGAGVETTDIRTGAALLIAGLSADGITTLGGLEQLRRGHAELPGKLRSLGADICEVAP
ncbi:UDP-N-acetylglucosamine 1-carboxyvinyltransferase [Streptomyces sp. NPDC021224]|uniref:UDP-N-acetylglucosamine 1-carboxyvinyltransferase n=1 Tax=unclassified Streptomyces TaxID=2593676 RepID=UPI0037AB0C63